MAKDEKQGKQNGRDLRAPGVRRGMQKRIVAVDPFSDPLTDHNSTKNVRRTVEIADIADRLSKSNPVAFYTKYSTFARDAATLPFATPLGSKHSIPISKTLGEEATYIVPGVMRLEFIPCFGVSPDYTSPINRSSVRFYTYLRSNQKASASYDHQDITMMELALDSLYMFHGMVRRAYGICKNFTPLNRYYARTLVQAMNFDYDDMINNLQDLRAYLNTFAYNAGQYAMPEDITLFKRHKWMVEGYYVDSPSTRAQTYLFVPYNLWRYDNTVATGSQLVSEPVAGHLPFKFADIIALGNKLLNAVSNDEDFAVISGDIYNFYGGTTYKLEYTDENYSIYPAYSEVVLSQIENAVVTPVTDSSLVVTQNPAVNQGAIVFNPDVTIQTANAPVFLNFHHDSPTPDDVIEATRLTTALVPNDGASSTKIAACGTEIIHSCTVYIANANAALNSFETHYVNRLITADKVTPVGEILQQMSLLAQFDWAPGFWVVDASETLPELIGSTWDIDNISEIPTNYLTMIHTAALYSLFEVGDNGQNVVSGK